jgi:hypothetical protein
LTPGHRVWRGTSESQTRMPHFRCPPALVSKAKSHRVRMPGTMRGARKLARLLRCPSRLATLAPRADKRGEPRAPRLYRAERTLGLSWSLFVGRTPKVLLRGDW